MFDGPYIRRHPSLANAWQALRPNQQGVLHHTILDHQPSWYAPARLRLDHPDVTEVCHQQVRRFAVLSDVHGQFDTLDSGIQLAGRGEILLDQQQAFFTGDLSGNIAPLASADSDNYLPT